VIYSNSTLINYEYGIQPFGKCIDGIIITTAFTVGKKSLKNCPISNFQICIQFSQKKSLLNGIIMRSFLGFLEITFKVDFHPL